MAEPGTKTMDPGCDMNMLPPDLQVGCYPSPRPQGWWAPWELNMKETADNWGIDRQVPFWHLQDKVANNQAQLESAKTNNQAQLELAKSNSQAVLNLAEVNSQADMRRFQSDVDLRRATDDNAKSLLQTAAISGYLRHVDDNHVMTTNILAALTEGLAWVRAMEVNITAAKSLDATVVGKNADIALKALDTAYGGAIGNTFEAKIPQPLVVTMK